ncbi:MAG TPA: DNA alkylation repair protein [Polyangiales bacterium]|nr:DNA alkylation repair protein [Polyangiales bacterium]
MKRRTASQSLLHTLRAALLRVAEPERARAMQTYMKSTMPYHGVGAAAVRAVCKDVFTSYDFESAERWRADVLTLWNGADFREERYAAISLSGHRGAKSFQTLEALPMYEEMVIGGAWWDYVDALAAHRIGPLLEAHPRELRRTLLHWSHADDIWKRRSAILAQLAFRERTDLTLLFACIDPSLDEQELFLRKAIGWALRQAARHHEPAIVRYVRDHAERLSPLSQREALKHVKG